MTPSNDQLSIDRRRALLYAALSREPELAMVHAWLDTWSGLGAIGCGAAV